MLATGCATEALNKPNTYTESVSSVLISQDQQKLVFIGRQYHYVFDAPPVLVQVLQSPVHQSVTSSLNSFHVDETSHITGQFALRVGPKTPDADKQVAANLGFQKYGDDGAGSWYLYKGTLNGTRFGASDTGAGNTQALNRTYQVTITESPTAGQKAAKAVLSPVATAADGVMFIGALPLLAVTTGMFAFACKGDTGCH
ncbi:MAG: hypothetical protein JO142_17540 [Burkholderiales bacterium]|nr:hypothetical protein [Burkholderiales bacterium]